MLKRLALVTSVLFSLVTSSLANFAFNDFSNVDDLIFVGDSFQAGNVLRVTQAAQDQTGAVWHNQLQNVSNAWTTDFDFRISDLDPDFGGADGFAFLLQYYSDTAIGNGGSGLGYDGIPRSLAIEFDLFDNGEGPNDNHISIQTNGIDPNSVDPSYSIGTATDIPDMSDGEVHHARITYSNSVLRVYLDDMDNPTIVAEVDIYSLLELESGETYVGFTGATGGGYENHDILNWSFQNVFGPVTSFNVTSGFDFQGDVASLFEQDGNELCLLNDDITLITQIEVFGQVNLGGTDYSLEVSWNITRPGLSMTLDLLLSNGTTWANVYGGTQVGQGGLGIGTSAGPFVGPNGEVGTRMTWQPINDEDPSQDGWAICLDYVHWAVN